MDKKEIEKIKEIDFMCYTLEEFEKLKKRGFYSFRSIERRN
jgi:hypothetical protein